MMALKKVKNLELKSCRNSELRSERGQFSGFFYEKDGYDRCARTPKLKKHKAWEKEVANPIPLFSLIFFGRGSSWIKKTAGFWGASD
jgi:hypothetical protein